MSTKTKLFSASLILAASLMTAGVAQALGPQDNRCWGKRRRPRWPREVQMGPEVPWATIRRPRSPPQKPSAIVLLAAQESAQVSATELRNPARTARY